MAWHPRQGRTDRRTAAAIAGQVSRRRIQLLAISAGQRLRSGVRREGRKLDQAEDGIRDLTVTGVQTCALPIDRKSTRLNSSHSQISYAVFCLMRTRA